MSELEKLIDQNIAPPSATHIGIFDESGNLVAKAPVHTSMLYPTGQPSYKFGVISDLHLGKTNDPNEQEDLRRALRFFNGNSDNGQVASAPETRGNGEGLCDFICTCGDVSDGGKDAQLEEYADIVDLYSPQTPVYTVPGNHDCIGGDLNANWQSIIGTAPNFVLTHTDNASIGQDDVFIFCGIHSYSPTHVAEHGLFPKATLIWLYQQLELYRNKRCFVFQHVRPTLGSGNAFSVYNYDIWRTTDDGTVFFEELMNHYKNTVFFHGHSHLRFQFQAGSPDSAKHANYSYSVPATSSRPAQEFRSIHIPSASCIRQSVNGTASGGSTYLYYGSEGYLVDVYPTFIILHGRDFNGYDSGEFAPGELIPTSYGNPAWVSQALYKIDTTLTTVEAGTFTTVTSILDPEEVEP